MNRVYQRLSEVAKYEDFEYESLVICDELFSDGGSIDDVISIFEFMENHPDVDYGTPGPLVNFMEKFYHSGYEDALVNSVNKNPTPQTILMLNRLINGTSDSKLYNYYIEQMENANKNHKNDEITRYMISEFLKLR